MDAIEYANKLLYAQERANATRFPYVITDIGHVLWDCPQNRRATKAIDATIIVVVRPQP